MRVDWSDEVCPGHAAIPAERPQDRRSITPDPPRYFAAQLSVAEGCSLAETAGWRAIIKNSLVGAGNLCHQVIFVNHASDAVAPPQADVV